MAIQIKGGQMKKVNKGVKEVKTVWTEEDANELLKKGWSLLHGGLAHMGNGGYQAKNCFVMGKYE